MDEKIINNIKSLAIDMIHEAGSGHPGIALGAAPILYTLYANHLNVSTSDENWMDRDRFVMSAGHGSALLYATLYMAGFNITLEDLKRFRRFPSRTPGHPEYEKTAGVDVSTGPLGQGIATAVGLALGEKMLEVRTNRGNVTLVNHKVYVLCGDGDLMEGISYEATSLAGSLKLNNLIVLYDSNNVSLDGTTTGTFDENIEERFKSIGWDYECVKDGTNISLIDKAIHKAKNNKKPTIIEVKTILGKGSYLEGTNQVHGKPLTDDDIKQLKYNLQMPQTPFYVDETLRNELRRKLAERTNIVYTRWANAYRTCASDEEFLKQIAFSFNSNIQCNFLNYDFGFDENMKEATRITNKKVMNQIASYIPFLVGGAADVSSTTNAYLDGYGDILSENYIGRNIHFGVREHAMGAIANGLALSNFRPFVSTFLCFSDYLKPAIRMSALMKLPVIYIFSHDSILVGQDGPTHQPIEQLLMLRSIPNTVVYRPCDANELIGTWNTLLNSNHNPAILILSRTDVPKLAVSRADLVQYGAYVIKKEIEKVDAILISSGTEVATSITLSELLYKEEKIDSRVISMPSMNLFDKQSDEYKQQLFENCNHIFMIEPSSTMGLYQYATDSNHVIGLDTFGVSGTKEEVLKEMHFDFESLKAKIKDQVKGQ
jgi:transketolase